ncbi:EAL domain-containing protein [Alteromonas gilva]|uniref:EAL domain-containing protein n=1 Tax=Alteromonas gilva TaxID=2987522 RepID=A0ABT5L8T3_9ALTE|nr:EAL domain-containing protein [Alteromonas gilva]MDC8832328.1 EAL domain-containing protein [Alteromonas gilva]
MSELFEFSEPEDLSSTRLDSWKVLSVEDDSAYQDVLGLALQDLQYQERGIELLKANSAAAAASILSARDDISLILLDVVMETDDAGLFLIETIRNVIGNSIIRIVMLTGQPGVMPRNEAIHEYDIAEYWNKTDLHADRLKSVVISNLRTWQTSYQLQVAKRGLQMIVDASRSLTPKQNTKEFANTVLEAITRVINIPNSGGIACIVKSKSDSVEMAPIVAASKHFKSLIEARLEHLFKLFTTQHQRRVKKAIYSAWQNQQHAFDGNFSILYFDTSEYDGQQYLMYVDSPLNLDTSHLKLLQVFSENISSGFVNQALMSRLSELAYLDSATGMHNRNWLVRELNQQTTGCRSQTTLVLFRLLNYESTEMVLGHTYATTILKAFSDAVETHFPEHYLSAVWDQETIALVFKTGHQPPITDLEAFRAEPIKMDYLDIQLQSQIGLLDFSDVSAHNLNQVLVLANQALNKAKLNGELVVKFDDAMMQRLVKRTQILSELKQALIAKDGFFMVLQPKVKLTTGEPVGFEALLRWRTLNGELCPPNEFIPIAEASGLSLEIAELVLHQTIAAIQRLMGAGYCLPISFNLANSDITSAVIFNAIHRVIDNQSIPPEMLDIEVTESQSTQDYSVINPILRSLIDKGVGVSIDDFGTGYSSLSQLTELAATTIKVDQKFVRDLSAKQNGNAIHIVQMISKLAERFKFNMVAEGVETEQQRQLLIDNKYEIAQGYLFARPMPVEDALIWLGSQSEQGRSSSD